MQHVIAGGLRMRVYKELKGLRQLNLVYDDHFVRNALATEGHVWSRVTEIELMFDIAEKEYEINEAVHA
jgi:hypothetical protein